MPMLWSETAPDAADLAACRARLRNGSRSFSAASRLLPREVRDAATALYAFCRIADDAVDLETGDDAAARQAARRGAVARLRQRLDLAYAGRPLASAEDRAFAAIVARYGIPRAIPAALLEGLEWDAAARRYETLSDLLAYAARVAGTVGVMMALLMGARSGQALARASDLGMAMQLSNIARDVGEDARAGRLYLPLAWLREEAIDPDAWLLNPAFSAPVGAVVQRLLAAAAVLYTRAVPGLRCLPRACRPGIGAALALYAEIGREVARNGYDSMATRAHVSTGRKLALIARSMAPASLALHDEDQPAALEARFLVEAAMTVAPLSRPRRVGPLQSLEARGVWLIDLFERLEHRQAELVE